MKNLNQKQIEDRVEMLQDAAQKLRECIELVDDALSGTGQESHADAYLVAHLQIWVGSDEHTYLCNDTGILDYIPMLREELVDEAHDEFADEADRMCAGDNIDTSRPSC